MKIRSFTAIALAAFSLTGTIGQAQTNDPAAPAATPSAAPAIAFVEETPRAVSATAQADLLSAYIWRGAVVQPLPVFQPQGEISLYGFTFNVWANMDLERKDTHSTYDNNLFKFTEVDLTLEYSLPLPGILECDVGYVQYIFPHYEDDWNTSEVYATFSLDMFLKPSLLVAYDVGASHGFYYNFGLGHELELWKGDAHVLSLDLGASIGFASGASNEYNFGADRQGFDDLNLTARLNYIVSENFTVYAQLAYMTLIDSEVRAAAADGYEGYKDLVYGGLGCSYSF